MQHYAVFPLLCRAAICVAGVVAVWVFCRCTTHLRPETQAMVHELEDSLTTLMTIADDREFLRTYIAFNVRFALRHKLALSDTATSRELHDELSKMALVQAAQRRIDAIQAARP
ncbi:MAG: hypothetical protein RML40_01950 [Bacteroidota bacterium]|nr:hypothetical protein [Candidatus Kapabacteria bacterium]MDW8219271.1 hypothetical protein [Bacteroidota bacterium]